MNGFQRELRFKTLPVILRETKLPTCSRRNQCFDTVFLILKPQQYPNSQTIIFIQCAGFYNFRKCQRNYHQDHMMQVRFGVGWGEEVGSRGTRSVPVLNLLKSLASKEKRFHCQAPGLFSLDDKSKLSKFSNVRLTCHHVAVLKTKNAPMNSYQTYFFVAFLSLCLNPCTGKLSHYHRVAGKT